MKIIIDRGSISQNEIDFLSQNNFDCVVLENDLNEYDFGNEKLFYDVIFITRVEKKVYYRRENKLFQPTIVKITDEKVWIAKEELVDAKVLNIQDFVCGKFITLLGECYSYNNFTLPENKQFSFLKYQVNLSNLQFNDFSSHWSKQIDVYTLGRYFPIDYSNDNLHVYSARILKCKKGGDHAYKLYKPLLDYFVNLNIESVDYIFTVPCRPDKPDRFKNVSPNSGIKLTSNYQETKGKSKEDKMVIMRNCFTLNEAFEIKGKNILLVDDVITSGATLSILSELLYRNGAKKISWLVYARNVHQEKNTNYVCNICGSSMRIFMNNSNFEWFVNCSNFNKCNANYRNARFNTTDFIYKNIAF